MKLVHAPLATLAILFAASATIGCGEPPGSIDESTHALVGGTWSDNVRNGSIGPNPFQPYPSMVPCEGYSSSDDSWHPGKVWSGTCRFEWGDRLFYFSTYRALQNPPSGHYDFADSGYPAGFTPENAVTSEDTSHKQGLPVCLGAGQAFGKVWNGTCRYEYGDKIHQDPVWEWVVLVP
jgi:hypothetical protein